MSETLLNAETIKTIDHWVSKFPPDRKRSAIINQFPLSLKHMNKHRRLAVFIGCEFLRPLDWNWCIAADHFLNQASHGFQA